MTSVNKERTNSFSQTITNTNPHMQLIYNNDHPIRQATNLTLKRTFIKKKPTSLNILLIQLITINLIKVHRNKINLPSHLKTTHINPKILIMLVNSRAITMLNFHQLAKLVGTKLMKIQ